MNRLHFNILKNLAKSIILNNLANLWYILLKFEVLQLLGHIHRVCRLLIIISQHGLLKSCLECIQLWLVNTLDKPRKRLWVQFEIFGFGLLPLLFNPRRVIWLLLLCHLEFDDGVRHLLQDRLRIPHQQAQPLNKQIVQASQQRRRSPEVNPVDVPAEVGNQIADDQRQVSITDALAG